MTRRMRVALTAITLAAASLATSPAASAERTHRDARHAPTTKVFTLDDSSHANPEGVAWDGKYFYVGATGDGTIYRGRLGDPTIHTFIPGVPVERSAVGLKTFHGRLYVAGGSTGKIFVFDLRHPAAAPLIFDTGAGGFLNDLVVTGRGDVFVTDSFRPTLWRIPAGQVQSGGTVDGIPVGPEIPYTANAFNLNGIVAFDGGRELVVVNTADGTLYRIRFDRVGHRHITALDAPALVGGDGMILDHGKLIVVRGNPASLTFLKLSHDESRARINNVVTDPTLRGPSTVARARDRYLVVNADFATSTEPFTVSGLPRNR